MNLKKVDENIKKGFKKFWFLLWRDNSLKGWIFSLIFLFIFVKFIFFPALSFVTGTPLPLAIVESCSMYHKENLFSGLDSWFDRHKSKYEEINIIKEDFQKFILRNGFNKGDILFITGANPEKLKIGDVILFNSQNRKNPVIHRIIKIERKVDGQGNLGVLTFTTMGDNNNQVLTPDNNIAEIDEREIRKEQLVGKAVFRVTPWFGWVKLIFFEYSRPESERGFCKEN